jgi:hypothetical protein
MIGSSHDTWRAPERQARSANDVVNSAATPKNTN